MSKTRREVDSLGEVQVPSEAYFGAQTVRAIANFAISGIPIRHLSQLINALAIVKTTSVQANARLGQITADKASAIAACDDIIAGKLNAKFPIDVFQGGAGTSTNMNINEVIANRALERMGFPRGPMTSFIRAMTSTCLSRQMMSIQPRSGLPFCWLIGPWMKSFVSSLMR